MLVAFAMAPFVKVTAPRLWADVLDAATVPAVDTPPVVIVPEFEMLVAPVIAPFVKVTTPRLWAVGFAADTLQMLSVPVPLIFVVFEISPFVNVITPSLCWPEPAATSAVPSYVISEVALMVPALVVVRTT